MAYFFAARMTEDDVPDWSVVGNAGTAGVAVVHLRSELAIDRDEPLLVAVVKTIGKPREVDTDILKAITRLPFTVMRQEHSMADLVKEEITPW